MWQTPSGHSATQGRTQAAQMRVGQHRLRSTPGSSLPRRRRRDRRAATPWSGMRAARPRPRSSAKVKRAFGLSCPSPQVFDSLHQRPRYDTNLPATPGFARCQESHDLPTATSPKSSYLRPRCVAVRVRARPAPSHSLDASPPMMTGGPAGGSIAQEWPRVLDR